MNHHLNCSNYLLTIVLALLLFPYVSSAQNVGINDNGATPNSNAMLDIVSPSTGNGKGILIPRVTSAQRTTADASLAGGLLDNSGNLRGGAAQGLLVFQTDGTDQGFYYNTSATATPSWVHLAFTPNTGTSGQFLQTNGSGSMSWQNVTTPITGTTITVGDSAVTSSNGVAIGVQANGNAHGTVIGYRANSSSYGTAVGYQANGYDCNVAIGYYANAYTGAGPYAGSVSVGYRANSFSGDGKYSGGVAIGYRANARHNFNESNSGAVSVGFMSNSFIRGVAVGANAAGYNQGAALGYHASGSNSGVAVGYSANGYFNGTAIGYKANSGNKNYSFAKGAYSKATRYNEEWKSSDGLNNKFGYGQVNFHGTTTTSSTTEIYLGGTSNQRFILQDNSAVTFQALVTGINTNTGDTSGWRCWGVIKRRSGANTTALVGAVNIDANTGGLNTNPTFTADTVYGALKLQVTGVNSNLVRWNAAMRYSEVRE